jgi:hypothetical protein
MRRAYEHGVRCRPIEGDVVDVAATAGGQPVIFTPQYMVADMNAAGSDTFIGFIDRHGRRPPDKARAADGIIGGR